MEAFNAQMNTYPTAAAAAGYTAPTGFTLAGNDLIGALMQQQGGATGPGPWLRDFPGNGNHYQIVLTAGRPGSAQCRVRLECRRHHSDCLRDAQHLGRLRGRQLVVPD